MKCARAVLYCHLWSVLFYRPVCLSTSSKKCLHFQLQKLAHKMCVFILPKSVAWNTFCILKTIQPDNMINVCMYLCLHVKLPFLLPHKMKLEYSRQTFERYSNAKFKDNPSSRRQVVLCGHKDRLFCVDMRTSMTKLRFTSRNSAN
jgi:hypothetical protein